MTFSPRRIAVIGRSGAGKTTVAVRIAGMLGLPVVHLDRVFWGPDWVPVATEVYLARQSAAIAADAWVIDGSYLGSPGWEERLQRAEVVVVVEARLASCLWRIVCRAFRRTAERRSDLPDGCQERLSLYHLWWAIGWSTRFAQLQTTVARTSPNARLIVVRSADQATRLLSRMPPDRQ